jgi:hypothetical protein
MAASRRLAQGLPEVEEATIAPVLIRGTTLRTIRYINFSHGCCCYPKVFSFDAVANEPFFGALPRGGWGALGVFEMLCAVLLVVPAAAKCADLDPARRRR